MRKRKGADAPEAAWLNASVFGILSGLGGMTHGIGEVLQGNVTPAGTVIHSWTQGPIAEYLGGEPAMTIIPNVMITGAAAIIVSLGGIIWSAAYMRGRRAGLVLILISIAMLLMGGGFGPPIIGILAGIAGLGIGAEYSGLRSRVPGRLLNVFCAAWPWIFGVSVLNGTFLVIGSAVLAYSAGFNHPDLFLGSFFLTVLLIPACILTGVGYDGDRQRGIEEAKI